MYNKELNDLVKHFNQKRENHLQTIDSIKVIKLFMDLYNMYDLLAEAYRYNTSDKSNMIYEAFKQEIAIIKAKYKVSSAKFLTIQDMAISFWHENNTI